MASSCLKELGFGNFQYQIPLYGEIDIRGEKVGIKGLPDICVEYDDRIV